MADEPGPLPDPAFAEVARTIRAHPDARGFVRPVGAEPAPGRCTPVVARRSGLPQAHGRIRGGATSVLVDDATRRRRRPRCRPARRA